MSAYAPLPHRWWLSRLGWFLAGAAGAWLMGGP